MSGVRAELRMHVGERHAVVFPNATNFVVLDDNTVVIRDEDNDDIAAIHPEEWTYVWIEGEPDA